MTVAAPARTLHARQLPCVALTGHAFLHSSDVLRMISFVIAASALTLLALAFVVVPVLRRKSGGEQAIAIEASNLALARAQRDEILRDHAAGLLSDSEREDALSGIARRLSQDLDGQPAPVAADPNFVRSPLTGGVKTVLAVLILGIPIAAGLLYWQMGSPEAIKPQPHVAEAPATDQQIIAMVDSLTEKMKGRPKKT